MRSCTATVEKVLGHSFCQGEILQGSKYCVLHFKRDGACTSRQYLACAFLIICQYAWVQNKAGQNIPIGRAWVFQEQVCRDTVTKFEESMAFIRKSVGYEKAAEMKEALLPNKLESELFAKEGYCGVARHLRAKKLIGK